MLHVCLLADYSYIQYVLCIELTLLPCYLRGHVNVVEFAQKYVHDFLK